MDILVNKVGAVTPRLAGFLNVTDEQWMFSLTLNLLAAVRTTRRYLNGFGRPSLEDDPERSTGDGDRAERAGRPGNIVSRALGWAGPLCGG